MSALGACPDPSESNFAKKSSSPSSVMSLLNFKIVAKFPPLSQLDQTPFLSASVCSHPKQHQHMLLVQGDRMQILSTETGIEISSWRLQRNGFIRNLQLSNDFLFVAILQSANVLEIKSLFDGSFDEPVLTIKRLKSDSILGFEWTFQGELMVLSKSGIDIYQVDSVSKKCICTNSISIHLNWYQYWAETKLLIISSGSLNLFLFKVKSRSIIETFPNLAIDLHAVVSQPVLPNFFNSIFRSVESLSIQITKRNVHTFSIYTYRYVGILYTWISIPHLVLYRISSKNLYRKEFDIDLLEKGEFQFLILDNLLVANNMSTNQSLVFDIKGPNPCKPLFDASNDIFLQIKSNHENEDAAEDMFLWKSIQPNMIISVNLGVFGRVSLNMTNILEKMESTQIFSFTHVTKFLLRREESSSFLLRTRPLYRAISSAINCFEIRDILDLLRKNFDSKKSYSPAFTLRKAISIASIASGFSGPVTSVPMKKSVSDVHRHTSATSLLNPEITSFQDDLFCHVLTPLATSVSQNYMIAVIIELIDLLISNGTVVKCFIYDLLVHLLFEAKAFVQLHQLIQWKIIPDSISLAKLLISDINVNNFDVGLEMLKRLECHHDVLSILTNSGRILEAIHYAQNVNIIRKLSPAPFFDAALATGDTTIFLNVYRFFEEHGLIPLSSQVDEFFSNNQRMHLSRYVSVFREILGPSIEMETI